MASIFSYSEETKITGGINKMKKITIFKLNVRGLASNSKYDNKNIVNDIESFRKAITLDYVFATYKDNHRSVANFIKSDCLPVDIDNDHSEGSSSWITVDNVKKTFPDVAFYVQYSRNHMKVKNGKKASPKFHVLFPIDEIANEKEYLNLKQEVYNYFPFIDNNALDSARFFFGTSNPPVEIVDGNITLIEFMKDLKSEELLLQDEQIIEGTRNATLHKSAVKILKRYGNTDESYSEFLKLNERCTPPLEDRELRQIWSIALKYYRSKIETSPDYVKPEDYEVENGIPLSLLMKDHFFRFQ